MERGDKICWWEEERETLLDIAKNGKNTPLYVYSERVIRKQLEILKSTKSISQIFYAIKANYHPDIMKLLYHEGLGFECVSPGELEYVLGLFPDIPKNRILFTPNFVPREEYEMAFSKGVILNLDSIYPLQNWPEVLRGKSFFLRFDPGTGRGSHQYTKTAGKESKFGIPLHMAGRVAELVKDLGATVVGLHAHAGSGILREVENWLEIAECLVGLRTHFPQASILNIGGGFGIVQNPHTDMPLDIDTLFKMLDHFKRNHTDVNLWIEPGRFIVADSGVLLTKITQMKKKEGGKHYIGVNTGFNSLIRPVLYKAYHHCVNLSRLHEPQVWNVDIVGNICESGDIFGADRSFPVSVENDVVLIGMVGAYGRSMGSEYNMRKPADEFFLKMNKSSL